MLKYKFRALGLALCWALACGSASVCAAVFTVDDSASSVLGDGKWRWRSLQFGSPDSMTVDSRFSVHAVLNTQPWVGKPARIYMLLAPQPTRLSLQWTTRGTLLAGRIEPGQRVLVFDGTSRPPCCVTSWKSRPAPTGASFALPSACACPTKSR